MEKDKMRASHLDFYNANPQIAMIMSLGQVSAKLYVFGVHEVEKISSFPFSNLRSPARFLLQGILFSIKH
jgi:hypothetical protein